MTVTVATAATNAVTTATTNATTARVEICFSAIDKFFHRRHLLDDLSLSLQGGRALLLSGENGAGKTTLLRILAGLEKPHHCMVDFTPAERHSKPRPWVQCRRRLQREVMYLHQLPYMFDGSVSHNLALALPRSMSRAQRAEKIRQALQWAQLEAFQDARAKTLSGGEKQRVSLARAWLRQARILLLDEPIANMDGESQARTVKLLHRLKNARAALMISSHNSDAFRHLIDHRLALENGKLGPAQTPVLPGKGTPSGRGPAGAGAGADAEAESGGGVSHAAG